MSQMTGNTSRTVNTIIYECGKTHDVLLRHIKLQKLLYLCFGHCLVENIELIDEHFEGWAYGCVVPSVYHFFKGYGYSYIREFGSDNTGKQEIISESQSPAIYAIVATTLAKYVGHDDMQLSEMNHAVNGAWWKAQLENRNEIKIEDIRNEFNGRD